jgi:hypothetical protein
MKSDSKCRSRRQVKGVTGRDGYILCKALAYGIETIERLPECWQESGDKEDMVALLQEMTADDRLCRTLARSHIERRGVKIVDGQIQLADFPAEAEHPEF